MTSSIPGVVVWPAVALLLFFIALRLIWHNATQFDVYANIMLCWTAVIQIMSDPFVQSWAASHSPFGMRTIQQVTLFLVLFGHAEFLGVAKIMSGVGLDAARRQQVFHRGAAVALIAVMFIAGSRARRDGLPLEVADGWGGVVVWGAFCVLPVISARWLFRLIGKELRDTVRSLRHLVLLIELGLAAVIVGGSTMLGFVLSILEELDIAHTADFREAANARGFFLVLLVLTALAAGSCASSVSAYFGMDRRGRAWRALLPLWSDLTSVFPETVMGRGGARKFRRVTAFQLHRTMVEVRDSILRLSPFMREATDEDRRWLSSLDDASSIEESETAARALQIAKALHAKRAGEIPANGARPDLARSSSRSLEDETAELLGLAKWWRAANEYVGADRRGLKNRDQKKEAGVL